MLWFDDDGNCQTISVYLTFGACPPLDLMMSSPHRPPPVKYGVCSQDGFNSLFGSALNPKPNTYLLLTPFLDKLKKVRADHPIKAVLRSNSVSAVPVHLEGATCLCLSKCKHNWVRCRLDATISKSKSIIHVLVGNLFIDGEHMCWCFAFLFMSAYATGCYFHIHVCVCYLMVLCYSFSAYATQWYSANLSCCVCYLMLLRIFSLSILLDVLY